MPTPAAQKKAEELVKEVYQAEYAKARKDNTVKGQLGDDAVAGRPADQR